MSDFNLNTEANRAAVAKIASDVYGPSANKVVFLDDVLDKAQRAVDNGKDMEYVEDAIFQTIWMWFPGGSTAENTARKIMQVIEIS